MVQFSFRPPGADYLGFEATPEGIIETACKAEELGFDAVLLNDHIIVDGTPRALPSWGNTYDPLIVLSYIAARTTRIRLGTSVLIMPYQIRGHSQNDGHAGPDVRRSTSGVGTGWCEAKFAALGVPFRERGARTTEILPHAQNSSWAPDPVTFHGRFFAFDDMYTKPKPLDNPVHPSGPVRPAMRPCAERGSLPGGVHPDGAGGFAHLPGLFA